MEIEELVNPYIRTLQSYVSARDDFSGKANVMLDANESPVGEWRRYPEGNYSLLRTALAKMNQVRSNEVLPGNGSDEIIDIILKVFCEPGKDKCLVCSPGYGMYKVAANVLHLEAIEVPLQIDFQLDVAELLQVADDRCKVLFLCSPNNPTGNVLSKESITSVLNQFKGIVVIDEAYADFVEEEGWAGAIYDYQNLIVLKTLSKAYGLAGLRLGMAIANERLISLLNKVRPPYNINGFTEKYVVENYIQLCSEMKANVRYTAVQRELLSTALNQFCAVERIYPSTTNFILIQVTDAVALQLYLLKKGIVVRNRSGLTHCSNCLRITIGTEEENQFLIQSMKNYEKESTVYR